MNFHIIKKYMTIPLALLIFIMSFNVSPARAAEDPAKYIQ
jgi:hypothetical protein